MQDTPMAHQRGVLLDCKVFRAEIISVSVLHNTKHPLAPNSKKSAFTWVSPACRLVTSTDYNNAHVLLRCRDITLTTYAAKKSPPMLLLSRQVLPKQEIFPETDARNWEKVTSITGLSATVTGNILGFKASPALLSASGTITCRVHHSTRGFYLNATVIVLHTIHFSGVSGWKCTVHLRENRTCPAVHLLFRIIWSLRQIYSSTETQIREREVIPWGKRMEESFLFLTLSSLAAS